MSIDNYDSGFIDNNAVVWLITCEQGHITKDVPLIFDAVFECTLDMINKVVYSYELFNYLFSF